MVETKDIAIAGGLVVLVAGGIAAYIAVKDRQKGDADEDKPMAYLNGGVFTGATYKPFGGNFQESYDFAKKSGFKYMALASHGHHSSGGHFFGFNDWNTIKATGTINDTYPFDPNSCIEDPKHACGCGDQYCTSRGYKQERIWAIYEV